MRHMGLVKFVGYLHKQSIVSWSAGHLTKKGFSNAAKLAFELLPSILFKT